MLRHPPTHMRHPHTIPHHQHWRFGGEMPHQLSYQWIGIYFSNFKSNIDGWKMEDYEYK